MTGRAWCEFDHGCQSDGARLMTGPVWCEFDDRSRVSLMTGPGYCEFDDGPPLV